MPCCWLTCARMSSAILVGPPSRRSAPDTLRNASSSDSGSTSGVTARKMAMTSLETSEYTECRGGMKTACGHSRLALPTGIADRTPNARASYVADSTTLRALRPPTTTGWPARSGRSRSSTLA
jgi:hypothetical protein